MWGNHLCWKNRYQFLILNCFILFNNPLSNSLPRQRLTIFEWWKTGAAPITGLRPSEKRWHFFGKVKWKIAWCLFIKIDHAVCNIIHVGDLCWLLLKRNTESVLWPFIRLAWPYQWIDGSISHCLVWQGKKERPHNFVDRVWSGS